MVNKCGLSGILKDDNLWDYVIGHEAMTLQLIKYYINKNLKLVKY